MIDAFVIALIVLAAAAGMTLFIAPFIVVSMIVHGWALYVLWGWFAVPILHAPAITMSSAIALRMVVQTLVPVPAPAKSAETTEKGWAAVKKAMKPVLAQWLGVAMVVGIAWLLKTYFLTLR